MTTPREYSEEDVRAWMADASSGDVATASFPLAELSRCVVTDSSGADVEFKHLDWLADLSKINWEVVEATHNFAVILPVPLWSLQRYIRSENIAPAIAKFLYCDADAITFQLLRMNFSFDSRSSFTSIHAKTSVLQATWRGLVEGLQTGPQGDIRQQGGAFVLGADEIINGEAGGNAASTEADEGPHIKCLWAHYDRYNADQVQIPVLLMAAGLPHTLYRH